MYLKKLRRRTMIFLAHEIGLPYFRLTRKPRNFPYSLMNMTGMAEGTVGRALYGFLHNNGLDLLPYYEKHDIKHVVLGYEATEEGEVSLQCFMLANGRITLPVLLCVLFGFLTMPEYYRCFIRAWHRGRHVPALGQLDWFSLPPYLVSEVRKRIGLH